MLCPYSLTLPGGVQMQVLGLARACAARATTCGCWRRATARRPRSGSSRSARACPPPPTARWPRWRRTRRPSCAPSGRCATRTSTSSTSTSPSCPGPAQTTLLLKTAPLIGTFHAAGESAGYKYLRPLVRWLAGRLDVRCAVSDQAAALARHYLEGDYLPVFNGIDVDLHAGADPWPAEGPTVFFVGRHEPRKGLDVLLEAVDRLPDDVRFWVAGDGPDTADAPARHTSDRIEWLGRISDDEKLRRIRGASVFCAPALRGESFGIVLLEGMAAGTPVVAGDIDGYRTVATDGRDAILRRSGRPRRPGPGHRAGAGRGPGDRRHRGGRPPPGRAPQHGSPRRAVPGAVRAPLHERPPRSVRSLVRVACTWAARLILRGRSSRRAQASRSVGRSRYMPTIRATCSDCGDVELTTADVRVRVCIEDSSGEYQFRCPTCRMSVVKPAEAPRGRPPRRLRRRVLHLVAPRRAVRAALGQCPDPRRPARLPPPAGRRLGVLVRRARGAWWTATSPSSELDQSTVQPDPARRRGATVALMSGWWLLAPVVLVVGIGLVAVTGRRLQREAAGVRYAAVELADLRAEGAALALEADELADHLTRTRATARPPLGGATGDR